jgi:opacity protein-like surface antigen
MKDYIRAALFSTMLLCLSLFRCMPAMAATNVASLEKQKTSSIFLNEIGFGSGYARGTLKWDADDFSVYPAFVRIGFNINSLVGLSGGRSTLQFALEPQINTISGPKDGVEAGCGIGFRYFRQLADPVNLFFEASFAPMFLSIDTVEQGAAGFNFLDQLGAGIQYRLSSKTAVFGGYRWRHISHAGISDRSNDGINSNAVVAGLSWLY